MSTLNEAQVATVGVSFNYDATIAGTAFTDPRGGGLRYTVTLAPLASGLTAAGARIIGTPSQPGVVTARVTAIDIKRDSAITTFPIVVFAAAVRAPALPEILDAYSDARAPLPAHFVNSTTGSAIAADNTPADNPITDAGATLGRVLFYDTRLSATDGMACASCHQQQFGFGDTARFSAGLGGAHTTRHTMALANARFFQSGRFFWDERAASLEMQTLQPIQNPAEMGLSLGDLELKLTLTPYYGPLLRSAFGSPEVTSDRVARALAQFVRSLISARAPADSVFLRAGPPDPGVLSAQEQLGNQLFSAKAGCAVCHRTNAVIVEQVRNTGLDAVTVDAGAGDGRMKAPSLRNIAIRPPYMHDGRFRTLEEVVEFYDSGIQPNVDLDTRLRAPDGSPKRLHLTLAERNALVAYLEALTDQAFLHDVRFGNPFLPR